MRNETAPPSDSSAKIEFAAWHTPVENDALSLGRLNFDLGSPLVIYPDGKSLALPPAKMTPHYTLEATFISIDSETVVRVASDDVIAFRVLDENGLLDLWHASIATPRPGQTTFRATGHPWTEESFLAFFDAGDRPRFSYFIATKDLCLELVCQTDPVVEILGPAIVESDNRPAGPS